MTDSMIPYSFTPGTKAKAAEVNANFIALASFIESNKTLSATEISNTNTKFDNKVSNLETTKADKTELIHEFTVSETETDLDDYKTSGTYIFSSTYTPLNIPKGDAGMLLVTGKTDSVIKQIWICDDENPEIYTRDFKETAWGDWKSTLGIINKEKLGYFKLPNGMMIQWGGQRPSSVVTYPIAYSRIGIAMFTKAGYWEGAGQSDMGLTSENLTGFKMSARGSFGSLNWVSIGF